MTQNNREFLNVMFYIFVATVVSVVVGIAILIFSRSFEPGGSIAMILCAFLSAFIMSRYENFSRKGPFINVK